MEMLTKQEELFLLAIFRIGEKAYLVNIREHLIEHAGKDWAFGSVYTSLEKLVKKGLIKTSVGEPSTTRGGKAIKFYALTSKGVDALLDTKKLHDTMWREFGNFAIEKGLK